MPRKPRIEYAGALYHVIVRGNQKQKIFKDTPDYQKYLQVVTSYKQRHHFYLYAYVLMSNHIHLLIEAQAIPLSKSLQGINQSYTMYFNRTYHTVGHLFQGRYRAILCEREGYLLALIKYIHHNPVRAKMIEDPHRYKWSSDHQYRLRTGNDALIDSDMALRMFSENLSRARRQYIEFMDDGVTVKKQDVYAIIDSRLLGDERFVDKIVEVHGGSVKKERRRRAYTLAQLASAIARAGSISPDELQAGGRHRATVLGRVAFTVLALEFGYRGVEIAEFLKRDPTAITQYARKREEAAGIIGTAEKLL